MSENAGEIAELRQDIRQTITPSKKGKSRK